jgi:tRNA(Ile)-lysidine synthase
VVVTADLVEGFLAPDTSYEAFVDADSLTGNLEVRGPLAGDRVRPLGASGARKLKDVLVDERVPASERPRRPLVVCGERVIWVCGLLTAEEAKITRDTRRFLRLGVAPAPPDETSGGRDRSR